uniref:Probable prefoldin subunit 6 n=1 Tax=Setaria digitata TaxID=48799 RepID=A0A915PPK6_9BILA
MLSFQTMENFDSEGEISVLDVTIPPVLFTKCHEKSQETSASTFAIDEQENSHPLIKIGLEKNPNPNVVFDDNGTPETPKSIEIIDLTTPKKVSQNRSPLLPTQPPPNMVAPAPVKRRSAVCCDGTLDSWIKRFKPPPKPKPNNADKYALWLNVSPDVSQEKPQVNKTVPPVITVSELPVRNISGQYSTETVPTNILCASQISSELASCTGSQSLFSNYDSGESGRIIPNMIGYTDENMPKSTHISPRRTPEPNQLFGKIMELQNSPVLLNLTLPLSSPGREKLNEGEKNAVFSLSDDSIPPTPSPPAILRKSKVPGDTSLIAVLNRSGVATFHSSVPESQHTRSLMKAISSPTFCQNDRKYVVNELASRYNDDGKVRRKKDERRLLHGFDCRCCAEYYEALGLSSVERIKRIDQVSKHRNTEREPSTPEYYWDIGMPSREEQRRRGQIIESNSPVALKTRHAQYKPIRPARRLQDTMGDFVMSKFEEELAKYKQLEKDREKNVHNRQQLEGQLTENNLVKTELDLLEDGAVVYKLIGPVLVKQELMEAKQNVEKRIDYITTEIKRLEDTMADAAAKQETQKQTVMRLQNAVTQRFRTK